jgi:hypothetical protein
MPKINGKAVDPKAYAKRLTSAKKAVEKIDPSVKRKIAEMYPNTSTKILSKKVVSPKKGKK